LKEISENSNNNGGSLKIQKTLSKRQVLALKIFSLIFIINTFIVLVMMPSEPKKEIDLQKNQDEIEIKIRGTLHTSFEKGKQLTLINHQGQRIGPATLVKMDDETLTIFLSKNLYSKTFSTLTQTDWVLLPYITQASKGVSYEIHY